MVNLLRSELFRARRRPQTWILLAIILLAEVAVYVALVITALVRSDPENVKRNIQLPKIYDTGLIIPNLVGTILVVIFASSIMGNEYGWNTLRPLLARSRSRDALLGAKWVAMLLYVVALTAVSIAVVYLLSIIGSLIVGVDTGVSGDTIVSWVEVVARYIVALAPYAALGLFMAVLSRSNTAGIALSIALMFIEPILFAALGALIHVFKTIDKGTLSWNTNRLTEFGGVNSDVTARQAFNSTIVCLVWTLLFIVVSFWIFRKRDVTSG